MNQQMTGPGIGAVTALGFLQEARCELLDLQAKAGRSDAGRRCSILITQSELLIAAVEYYAVSGGLEPEAAATDENSAAETQ